MADGRPHQRPPSWYDHQVRRQLERERAKELQNEISAILATPLNPSMRLDRSERLAIREACTPRVRR